MAEGAGAGFVVLRGAALVGGLVAVAAVGVGALAAGSPGAFGALVGGAATLLVLALGTWAVLVAAAKAPTVSLMVALGAFTLQGLLLAGVLAIVAGTTDRTHTLAAAFTVMAVTIGWTTAFAVLVRRERIPIFDLGLSAPPAAEPGRSHEPGPDAR